MNREEILRLPSMPAMAPSYPRGPYRFINREYLIVSYKTDPDVLRTWLPEPLEMLEQPLVAFEFIHMPDSSGFGSYTESGVVIPCQYRGERLNYVAMMFLDNEPPISGGREIWGFPKKFAHPKLSIEHDTLTGSLYYSTERVATATMGYKFSATDPAHAAQAIGRPQVALKIIPHVDGTQAIAQLVKFSLVDISVKGAWAGPARLHLTPHVHAPVADLPVVSCVGAEHIIADLTLPFGEVLYDYLK